MSDTTSDNNGSQTKNSTATVVTPNTAQTHKASGEHSNVNEALEQAVASVPLKDYSDYEIILETKQQYQDALFSDENELNQALKQTGKQQQSIAKHTSATPQPEDSASNNTLSSVDLDFSAFLTAESIAGFTEKTANAGDKINIINSRLNGSPARKEIIKNTKADQFDKHLVSLAEKLASEKQAIEEIAQTKLKVAISCPTEGGKLARITQNLITKSKELSLQSIAKIDKSKTDLDEYLGLSLPERTLALNFILPTLKTKQEQDDIPSKQSIEKLFSIKGNTLASILNKSNSDLGKISKIQLSNSHRLELLDSYMPLLGDKIESLISMFERKPSVTDEGKRLLILDNAIASIKHLVTGYKQVYASLYKSANVIYGPQRKVANDTAIKILVYLHLEKRLAIATHSNTTHISGKTFNTVFHVLKTYEPQVLLQPLTTATSTDIKTVTDLFVDHQLLQAFDFRYISTCLHRALRSYINTHRDLLEIIEPELTDSMTTIDAGQQLWQCNFDANSPVFISNQQAIDNHTTETSKPVYIKIQLFFNRIKTDYVSLLKNRIQQRKNFKQAALSDIDIHQALTLFSAMNLLVMHCENHTKTPEYTIYRPTTISAYTSKKSVTDYFRHIYSTQVKGKQTKSQNINDTPKPLASKSRWRCATEDENIIYLQTAEDKLAITLDVGDLILLVHNADTTDDSDGQKKAQMKEKTKETVIGKVTYLDRGPQAKLSMAIQKYALDACVINVDESDDSGILIQSTQGHRLILNSDNAAASDQLLTFTFADDSNGYLAINGLEHICNDGDIFALS